MGDQTAITAPVKHRKSLEDTIQSLRIELRSLYDSLKDKNDQLSLLEKELRDRDMSLCYLNNELKRLKTDDLGSSGDTVKPSKVIENNGFTVDTALPTESNNILHLQSQLRDRDRQIKDLNEKILRQSNDLAYVQKLSIAKDEKVFHLQNELDKFRLVVRPLTQAMIERQSSGRYDYLPAPGIEQSTRALSTGAEPRIKRQAISAEPLSTFAGLQTELMKIPKSTL